MYICLNRGTCGGSLPTEAFAKLASDAGFTGADLDIDFAVERGAAATTELFERHRLRFGGWGVPVDWRGAAPPDPEAFTRMQRAAETARALGVDSCSTWVMPSSEQPFAQNWAFHVERLRPIARILDDSGLRLGLEFVAPHHLRRKFPHEFVFAPGSMLELADAIGSNVGLLIDSFHVHVSGTTFDRISTIPRERIVLAHVNDAPRGDVATIDDGDRLLPGDGAIDLPSFLGALAAAGYDGPVSLEVFNETLRAMPPLDAARLAWKRCKPLLPFLETA